MIYVLYMYMDSRYEIGSIIVYLLQLISDAGYQGEITSVSTACHQIEVFSRVLRTSITGMLEGGEEIITKNLPEFTVSLIIHYSL